jgi:hypothetical protein
MARFATACAPPLPRSNDRNVRKRARPAQSDDLDLDPISTACRAETPISLCHHAAMMHADLPTPRLLNAESSERRALERSSAGGEVLLAWNHDLSARVRLGVIDLTEDGMRVRASLPILDGMTGIVIRLLPSGADLHRVFRVKWVREHEQGGFEAGLRFLS